MDDLGYDAFSAGVEPGGLRNTAQIKILIGFIVKSLDRPIEKSRLIEALQLHGLANYFDASQALADQSACENLTADENDLLYITEKGRAAVNELEGEIPRSVREKALGDSVKLQTLERRRSENKITVIPEGDGYNVTFEIFDRETLLLRLSVYAADREQVDTIKANYLKDPVSLYSGIIASLFT